jgi:hypothetical protein
MKDAPELRDTEAQIHNLLTLAAEQVRGTATPLAPATATPGLDLAARLTALAANGAGARVAVPFIQVRALTNAATAADGRPVVVTFVMHVPMGSSPLSP